MVIECPSCRTKFAVDPELLEGVNQPRFHCSRCDHFFDGAKNVVWEEPPAGSAGEERLAHDGFQATFQDGNPESAAVPALPPPAELPGGEQLQLPLDYTGESDEPPLSPQLFLDDLEHEIEQSEKESYSKGVVVPWPSHPPAASGRPLLETDLTRLSERGQAFQNVAAAAAKAPWNTGAPWIDRGIDPAGFGEDGDLDNIETPASRVRRLEAEGSRGEAPQDLFASRAESGARRMKRSGSSPGISEPKHVNPAVLLILPVLLAGGLMWRTVRSPSLPISRLPGFFSMPREKVPPMGISVHDTTSAVVPLESGVTVLQVSGNVANETDFGVEHVLLEAKLFNGEGQEIRSLIVPHANLLEDTRVESLSADRLEELGRESAPGSHLLEPGEAHSFRIILADVPPETSDFGIRVYSVEREGARDSASGSAQKRRKSRLSDTL